MIFDDHACSLGEGPLWHPERQELFWFDINARTLQTQARSWHFDISVSAAGWIDENCLLIASEIGLHRFDIESGTLSDPIVELEADTPITRSNDGRADPWGGFWIGTMGYAAQPGAGAIYRFYKGELRKLISNVTISNAICFDPRGRFANYTDTPTGQIMRLELDPATGWPLGDPALWLDLTQAGLAPDGAVMDADGLFWVACWGAGAVVGFDRAGQLVRRLEVPGLHTTCPAFGGAALRDLYVTSATEGITGEMADNGKTFCLADIAQGQREHQVIL